MHDGQFFIFMIVYLGIYKRVKLIWNVECVYHIAVLM